MTEFTCVGIGQWREGDFDGHHYKNRRIYFTLENERVLGLEAGFFTVKELPDGFKVGSVFNPVYNRYGKIDSLVILK